MFRWPNVILSVAAAILVLLVGGLLFAASGLYNVAARPGHLEITTWLIELTLRRSVATRSRFIDPPPLDNSDLVRLGAAHFQASCAPCHGAPGQPNSPIVRHMLPHPPDLSDAVKKWSDRELHWIIDNGLKYTGMPAWPAAARKDEVWAMVAFLRQLPALDAEAYRVLGRRDRNPASRQGGWSADLLACGRCHDSEGRPPASRLVPSLGGQSPAYLAAALGAYRSGRRQSGIMQPVAALLDDAAIARLAKHYADQPAPRVTPEAAPAERLTRGRTIAASGVPEHGVPPCLTCHAGGFAAYPRIAGQSAAYIRAQLQLWQAGHRGQTVLGQIMAPIARRLSPSQIEDVAAYLESADPEIRLGNLSP